MQQSMNQIYKMSTALIEKSDVGWHISGRFFSTFYKNLPLLKHGGSRRAIPKSRTTVSPERVADG
jgi:hypothetical protein